MNVFGPNPVDFVSIASGTFVMRSTASYPEGATTLDRYVAAFRIARTPVTNRVFVGYEPSMTAGNAKALELGEQPETLRDPPTLTTRGSVAPAGCVLLQSTAGTMSGMAPT